MTEYETLKRCPKCGSEPMSLVYTSNPPQYGYSHCGIDSGCSKSRSEAVAKWNEQVYLHTHQEKADKFTQKEVIKALECHIGKEPKRCELCPYTIYGCDCLEKLHFALYDLIKRLKTRIVRYQLKNTNQRNALASLNKKVAEQKAEIEKLNKKLDESLELAIDFEADLNNRDVEIKDLKAEIERLTEELKITRACVHDKGLEWGLISIKKLVDDTKTEAIKEFAEMLKNEIISDTAYGCDTNQHTGYYDYQIKIGDIPEYIDNLVKEMTEVDK